MSEQDFLFAGQRRIRCSSCGIVEHIINYERGEQ